MTVGITGASGLVGSALVPLLRSCGHRVISLRRAKGSCLFSADVQNDSEARFDAVVHLAGEPIGSGRWNDAKKSRIRDSRIEGTRLLCQTLADSEHPPRVIVCASAIGVYGDRGNEILDEASAPGHGFLADVVQAWEESTSPATSCGIRVACLRFGMILSPIGGALAKMLRPFKLGLGGPIGSGRQYWSWIAIDDALGAIGHALMTDDLSGPVNAVAPQAVTNAEFTAALGRVLRRPAIVAVPAWAARAVFGEMADELLLASARVEPRRLMEAGYVFHYGQLDSALCHLLGEAGRT